MQSKLIRLEATYPDQATARIAADDLVAKGFTRTTVDGSTRNGETAAEHRDIEEQTEEMVAGPGVVATKGMAIGAVAGALVLGVLGGVLGLLVASITNQTGTSQTIVIIASAVAGLTGGFVAGGFWAPRRIEEPHEPQPGWTTISLVTEPDRIPMALEALRDRDPERIDMLDDSGRTVTAEEIDLRENHADTRR